MGYTHPYKKNEEPCAALPRLLPLLIDYAYHIQHQRIKKRAGSHTLSHSVCLSPSKLPRVGHHRTQRVGLMSYSIPPWAFFILPRRRMSTSKKCQGLLLLPMVIICTGSPTAITHTQFFFLQLAIFASFSPFFTRPTSDLPPYHSFLSFFSSSCIRLIKNTQQHELMAVCQVKKDKR